MDETKLAQTVFQMIQKQAREKINCMLVLTNKKGDLRKTYGLYLFDAKNALPSQNHLTFFHKQSAGCRYPAFKYAAENPFLKMTLTVYTAKKKKASAASFAPLSALLDYAFLQFNTILKHSEYLENIKIREKGIIGLNEFADLLNYLETSEETAFQSMFLGFAAESIEANRVTFYFYEKERDLLYPNAIMVYKDKKVIPYDYYSELKDITVKSGDDICGNAIISREPIFLEKMNDQLYKGYVDRQIKLKINSIIDIPIIIRDNIIGVLELANSVENKPFNKFDFYIVSIIAKLAMTKMEQGELYSWAMVDNLTQLYNYHYLQIYLNNEMARLKRYAKELGLILIDIDNFKKINDTYGHAAGNIVLRSVSKIIKQNIRLHIDIPVRYGGDEFLIILPETNTEGTNMLANRILEIIRSTDFQLEGTTVNATCSMGVSNINAGTFTHDKDEIIKKADIALYKAKNAGKNRIVLAV